MKFFEHSEFDQEGLPGSGFKMNQTFLIHLDELRRRCNFPFIVSSGYRSPEYNAKISPTGLKGPHTTGKAVDLLVSREQAYIILREALAMKVFTGIGVNQKGESRFLHLDTLTKEEASPRPTVWSY